MYWLGPAHKIRPLTCVFYIMIRSEGTERGGYKMNPVYHNRPTFLNKILRACSVTIDTIDLMLISLQQCQTLNRIAAYCGLTT